LLEKLDYPGSPGSDSKDTGRSLAAGSGAVRVVVALWWPAMQPRDLVVWIATRETGTPNQVLQRPLSPKAENDKK
jgi:hypothetical protein